MGTKIGHYFDKEEEKYLPLVPQANSTSCGRVFITDDTGEESTAEEKAVVLSPFAVNNKITTLQESITTAYQNADDTLKKEITGAYQDADTALEKEITNAYKAADEALEGKITSAYQGADESIANAYKAADKSITDAYQAADKSITNAYKTADEALEGKITSAYQGADKSITNAYKAADEALEKKITSGTVAAAKKLDIESNYTGAKILNFTSGTPSWCEDEVGDSTHPVYVVNGAFSTCSGTMHNITKATIDENATTSASLGDTSVTLISNVTLAMEGSGAEATTTGHISKVTQTNLSLNKANGTSLGGVKTSKDLAFTNGEGAVVNLNLSSVKVDGGNTTLQDTLNSTYLKKSGDTFTGSLIGNKSNIIFTGDNNGLLWRLGGVDYDLLKTDTVSKGYIYTLGSTAFDTHIKGTSLYLQPSSGYLHINGAQGKNILQDAGGITLGNDQSSLYLLSSDKGIHTNYPVQMHAVRYHLHEGLGSGSSYTDGVPITDKIQKRKGACLPLELFSATSSFMGATDGNSKLFDRVYYWGDGSDSNTTGYDLAENALIAKYSASLLISGTIYANQLEAGSSIGGQIVYSTDGGKTFNKIAGSMETRLPSAATTGHVVIPPVIVKVTKGSRIGLRCYTYTDSGYVPTHVKEGKNDPKFVSATGKTHLDIVCLGLTA